jgi:integrase
MSGLNQHVGKFTDAVVAQAVLKPTKYELVDQLRKGLRVVIRPNGRRVFILRYTRPKGTPDAGASNSYKLCEYTGTGSLARAIEAYKNAQDALAAGRDPGRVANGCADPKGALAAYVALYQQDQVAAMKPGSQLNARPVLAALVKAYGDRDPMTLKKSEMVALINDARRRGPHAAHKAHCVLHAFCVWLGAQLDDFVNPLAGTAAVLPEVKPRDRVLDDAELRELLRSTDSPFVWLLALTGARRCEISDLSWAEVRKKALVIPAGRTKSEKTFSIAITPAVRRVLDSLTKTGKYVCNGADQPFGSFSKLKKRLPKLSREWTYHDLRRTFSTGLAALGVAQEVIDACTQHAAGTIQQTYNLHGYSDEMREAWELWAKHVAKITRR